VHPKVRTDPVDVCDARWQPPVLWCPRHDSHLTLRQTFRTFTLAATQVLTSALMCEDLSVRVLHCCTVDRKDVMTV